MDWHVGSKQNDETKPKRQEPHTSSNTTMTARESDFLDYFSTSFRHTDRAASKGTNEDDNTIAVVILHQQLSQHRR